MYVKKSLKKIFLYINVNNNDSHHRKTTCTFLYIQKPKKIAKRLYIYKNPDTFKKLRQFALRFYSQKSRHFTLRNFSRNSWNWYLYIYKNHDNLRYVLFLYTKSLILQKKQDNLRYAFHIQKAWHFVLRDCSSNFWNF